MMRRIIILILVIAGCRISAQQLPQYSQYMLNQLAINPAVAGTSDHSEVRANVRNQWLGLPDGPRTYMMSLHGPLKDRKMGLGMNMYADIVGPTRRTGINLNYAY